MRFVPSVAQLLLSLLLCFNQSTVLAATSPVPVLVWGDSLSAAYGIPVEKGWVALLQAKLGTDFKVINGSISGETTDGGLTRLPAALQTHQPAFVLLELGANDGLRGQATAKMQANLEQMLKLTQTAGAKTVLLGIKLPPNYGPAYTEAFEKVYSDLAQQYALPFVPFLLETVALDFNLMQADGLHPTAEAQAKILEHVWPTLEPVFKASTATAATPAPVEKANTSVRSELSAPAAPALNAAPQAAQ